MPNGRVVIKTIKPGPDLSIVAWIGEAGPTVTGGFGGWDIVSRPRRVSVTMWRGREPIQMELPIVIDAFDGTRDDDRLVGSQELTISRLERMALPWQNGDPPKVQLTANPTNAIQHHDLTWIINALAMGANLKNNDGNRIRQEVTLTLVSYVGVEKVKIRAAQRARSQ